MADEYRAAREAGVAWARFLHTEPLARAVTTAADTADTVGARQDDVDVQFRAWDMLSGAIEPELGGHARYLDDIGINCYPSRQTESRTLAPLPGRRGARRRMPLHRVLSAVHQRYARPMMIGERSPIGVGRGAWLREMGTVQARIDPALVAARRNP